MPRTNAPLSPKEERFIAEYLIDGNGTRSAISAGYKAGDTAKRTAYELLRRPRVKAALLKAQKAQQERTLITADKVLLDIQAIGNQAWKAKDFTQALRSRELLGKRYKLFTDRVEVLDTTPRAERLAAARQRKKQDSE
jgi:phage terminase small subunit